MKPLTRLVDSFIESGRVAMQDWLALETPDSLEVAAQDSTNLHARYRKLDMSGRDALVLSACVQMPSLSAIQKGADQIGLTVASAAACTTHQMLRRQGLETRVPDAGALLSGSY